MRLFPRAIVAALVVGGAAWATWPAPVREGNRFDRGEALDLEFPDGGTAAGLVCVGGRVLANWSVGLVFRWLVDPVAIDVTRPLGEFELRLGPPGTGVWIHGDPGGLAVRGEEGEVGRAPWPAGGPGRVRLGYADGAYRALADDTLLCPPLARPAPRGPAALVLFAGASMAGLDCDTAGGISRHIEGERPPPGWEWTGWAALVALAGLAMLSGLWDRVGRGRAVGAAARLAGLLAAAVLVVGLPLGFLVRNAARGAAPDPCATIEFTQAEPSVVEPGQPLALGDRRDGDFRLTAEVVLGDASVIDVLVRAELPQFDRQVFVTLSSDPGLPSGVGRNLGTELAVEAAPAGRARLPAERPLRLEIECRDDRTEAWIDGASLGAVHDLDLRAGRTAFHALAGSARVSALRLAPTAQPGRLAGPLKGRAFALAGGLLAALLLMAWPGRMGWSALLWVWPVSAVAIAPRPLPDAAQWFAAFAALLLLALLVGLQMGRRRVAAPDTLGAPPTGAPSVATSETPHAAPRGRRLAALGAGAVGIAALTAAMWGLTERPAEISPAILNRLGSFDIAGGPFPARYAWARHPLCRRFNPYLRTQLFRERRHALAKPDGVRRIVALGSSSTYGYGVRADEAWGAQLERLLSGPGAAAKVEVLNAGVPGATAERLRYFLGGVLLPLRPDVVIVDLSFNDRSAGGAADEREHFRAMTSEGIGGFGRLLARALAGWRTQDYGAYLHALEQGRPVDPEDVARFSLEPARRFQDALREMATACRQAGAAFVLVQEPRRPGEAGALMAPYHEAMAELGRELGAPVVSPQAALDAAATPMFIDAVHPTPTGHAVIARQILLALREAGLAGR